MLLFHDCMAVVLRRHGGDWRCYCGSCTVPRWSWRCHGGHGGAAAIPLRIGPTRGGTSEVLNMFKVSAVLPRRSAVLTVFRGATAINDGTTAEPRRSWRCHCGLCRTSTAVAPRLRCDGTSTAEAWRNMFKVAAVPPRRSAVLTVFYGPTIINGGTTAIMAVQLRFMPYKHRSGTVPPVWRGVFHVAMSASIVTVLCVHGMELLSVISDLEQSCGSCVYILC